MARWIDWLRYLGVALRSRFAAARLQRRMRRAQAQLSPLARAQSAFWRARYLARAARLQRERVEREALRESRAPRHSDEIPATPAQAIGKDEVLAAIARGRARRRAHAPDETTHDGTPR